MTDLFQLKHHMRLSDFLAEHKSDLKNDPEHYFQNIQAFDDQLSFHQQNSLDEGYCWVYSVTTDYSNLQADDLYIQRLKNMEEYQYEMGLSANRLKHLGYKTAFRKNPKEFPSYQEIKDLLIKNKQPISVFIDCGEEHMTTIVGTVKKGGVENIILVDNGGLVLYPYEQLKKNYMKNLDDAKRIFLSSFDYFEDQYENIYKKYKIPKLSQIAHRLIKSKTIDSDSELKSYTQKWQSHREKINILYQKHPEFLIEYIKQKRNLFDFLLARRNFFIFSGHKQKSFNHLGQLNTSTRCQNVEPKTKKAAFEIDLSEVLFQNLKKSNGQEIHFNTLMHIINNHGKTTEQKQVANELCKELEYVKNRHSELQKHLEKISQNNKRLHKTDKKSLFKRLLGLPQISSKISIAKDIKTPKIIAPAKSKIMKALPCDGDQKMLKAKQDFEGEAKVLMKCIEAHPNDPSVRQWVTHRFQTLVKKIGNNFDQSLKRHYGRNNAAGYIGIQVLSMRMPDSVSTASDIVLDLFETIYHNNRGALDQSIRETGNLLRFSAHRVASTTRSGYRVAQPIIETASKVSRVTYGGLAGTAALTTYGLTLASQAGRAAFIKLGQLASSAASSQTLLYGASFVLGYSVGHMAQKTIAPKASKAYQDRLANGAWSNGLAWIQSAITPLPENMKWEWDARKANYKIVPK